MRDRMNEYNLLIVQLVKAREAGELRNAIAKSLIDEAMVILRSMARPDTKPELVDAMVKVVRARLEDEFIVV